MSAETGNGSNPRPVDPGRGELNRVCSYCNNTAIGYEAGGDRGMLVCKDHASERLLSMKPGEIFDEKGDMLSWEFLAKTRKINPIFLHRFQDDPSKIEPEVNVEPGLWEIDTCANVLMVHRKDIHKLIRNGYLKTKEINGVTYVKYPSFHHYINYRVRWGFLLPIFWRDSE
jgi:hypothetical protein